MQTIVSYATQEQRTFDELPFNAVDSLVLCTLTYLKLEDGYCGVQPSNDKGECALIPFKDYSTQEKRIRLHDLIVLTDWDKLTVCGWIKASKETFPFIQALLVSRRFRDVEIAYFSNIKSENIEKQFSAMTFFLPLRGEEIAYLAFRGTDGSLAGWKENFNMCFRDIIPSHQSAAAYLSGVASACTCPLYVGGHSKGGNFAEYAACVADEEVFNRLLGILNHDGPSFLEDPTPRIKEDCYIELLQKIVPESSAFGMVLERRSNYRVVESNAISISQHEPFTWIVENNDFKYQEELNSSAVFFDEALDSWLRSKSPAERERFIDTIYDVLNATDATTWYELREDIFTNARKVLSTGSKLDPETKRFLVYSLAGLGAILKQMAINRFTPFGATRFRDEEGSNT